MRLRIEPANERAPDRAGPAPAPPPGIPDDEVVRRVLGGDLASFELIMRRYNQRLFRVARSILNDEDEAQDVLQETYIRAFEHLGEFEGRAKFSTWLTRIAVYEASARRRKRRRLRLIDTDMDTDAQEGLQMFPDRPNQSGEGEASTRELGQVLVDAVDALPDELRAVFVIRVVEGLDTDQAAQCLELTESNVKVRLHRARTLLRTSIDRKIGEEARRLYQFDGARCDRLVAAVLNRLLPKPE